MTGVSETIQRAMIALWCILQKNMRDTVSEQYLANMGFLRDDYIEMKRSVPLSDCKRFLIFRSEFSTIPRKISAYLRTDFPSGANTRNMRGFYKELNINDLCFMCVLSHCKKHHFVMRNGQFRGLKSTISHHEMGFFGLRNGQYQKAERTF